MQSISMRELKTFLCRSSMKNLNACPASCHQVKQVDRNLQILGPGTHSPEAIPALFCPALF